MDYRFDENEQMIDDMFRRVAKEQLIEAGAEADRQGQCPDELVQQGLELGLYLDAVPESAGGYLEDTYSHSQRIVRVLALSSGCPAIATAFESNTEFALACNAIGGEAAELLSSLVDPLSVRGSLVLSRAASEIKLSDDGSALSGRAGAVPNIVGAKYAAVVSTEDADTPFVAIAEVDNAAAQRAMGLRAANVGAVEFSNTAVIAAVSGDEARALVSTLRNAHRVFAGALGVGPALAALDYAQDYAADRIQFGQPILRFESLARLIHENRGRLHAAKYLVLAAAQAIDHGDAAATQLCRYASTFAGEAAVQAAIDAVQVYGGYGFVNDYPVEKIMRDVRAVTTMAGDGLREQVFTTAA